MNRLVTAFIGLALWAAGFAAAEQPRKKLREESMPSSRFAEAHAPLFQSATPNRRHSKPHSRLVGGDLESRHLLLSSLAQQIAYQLFDKASYVLASRIIAGAWRRNIGPIRRLSG